MALAQQPRLLLLDEPTQGLSVEETAQAVETLSGLLSDGGLTVLLVEHDMEVVFRLAHKITVLHRGAVIADGRPETVRADAGGAGRLSRRVSTDAAHRGPATRIMAPAMCCRASIWRCRKGASLRCLGRNGVGKTTTLRP